MADIFKASNEKKDKIAKKIENFNSIQVKQLFREATAKKLKKSLNSKIFDNAYNKLKLEAKLLYGGIKNPVLSCLKTYLSDHLGDADISHFYLECESGNKTHTLNNSFRRSIKWG